MRNWVIIFLYLVSKNLFLLIKKYLYIFMILVIGDLDCVELLDEGGIVWKRIYFILLNG